MFTLRSLLTHVLHTNRWRQALAIRTMQPRSMDALGGFSDAIFPEPIRFPSAVREGAAVLVKAWAVECALAPLGKGEQEGRTEDEVRGSQKVLQPAKRKKHRRCARLIQRRGGDW